MFDLYWVLHITDHTLGIYRELEGHIHARAPRTAAGEVLLLVMQDVARLAWGVLLELPYRDSYYNDISSCAGLGDGEGEGDLFARVQSEGFWECSGGEGGREVCPAGGTGAGFHYCRGGVRRVRARGSVD